MTKFEVGIPTVDANQNYVDTTSLQSSMESIASDGLSHLFGQDTIFKAGNFQIQDNILFWIVADTDVSAATSNFNTFIANYTFSVAPYAHSWTVN